jgi:hypothetical protein
VNGIFEADPDITIAWTSEPWEHLELHLVSTADLRHDVGLQAVQEAFEYRSHDREQRDTSCATGFSWRSIRSCS